MTSTLTSSSSSSATTKTSVRYQRLLQCIPVALDRCHAKIDVERAIRLCYGGNDTTSDNDIFCTMLRENILREQFHNDVVNGMVEFFQQQNVEEKLHKLEAIIRKVDDEIQQKEGATRKEKESTIQALQQTKSNISPADMIQYQSYQHLLNQKKSIENEIQQMELQIQQLQSERHNHLQQYNDQTNTMNTTVRMELEQAADLCSLIQ